MSYLDVEWIHRKMLEAKIGKVRVRKFIEKYLYTQTNWGVDEIFNPNFTKVRTFFFFFFFFYLIKRSF